MRRQRIDIGSHHIRLDLVGSNGSFGTGMVDRVDHGGQLPGPFAVAEGGKGHGGPDCPMRVLAAILTHPRYVAADVAWIQLRLVERRVKQLDQPGLTAYEVFVDSLHGLFSARRIGYAREHGPALRDGIDPAFGAGFRPERRAVVEIGTAIPGAIPALLINVLV